MPFDMTLLVLTSVDAKSLGSLASTCKTWRAFVTVDACLQIRKARTEARGDLVRACAQGFLDVATRLLLDLLRAQDDSEETDVCEINSALVTASLHGHDIIVRLLLDRGNADVNTGNNLGKPLVLACFHGHVDVIRLLLNRGAEVNVSDGEGTDSRALTMACMRGHTAAVSVLLDHGARADSKYALLWASINGHTAIVSLLLDRGAGVNSGDGCSLHLPTIDFDDEGFIENILLSPARCVDVKIIDDRALCSASAKGHVDVARLLLERGGPDKIYVNYGYALVAASKNGHVDLVRLLLERGGSEKVHVKNALRSASANGHVNVVRLLSSVR